MYRFAINLSSSIPLIIVIRDECCKLYYGRYIIFSHLQGGHLQIESDVQQYYADFYISCSFPATQWLCNIACGMESLVSCPFFSTLVDLCDKWKSYRSHHRLLVEAGIHKRTYVLNTLLLLIESGAVFCIAQLTYVILSIYTMDGQVDFKTVSILDGILLSSANILMTVSVVSFKKIVLLWCRQ